MAERIDHACVTADDDRVVSAKDFCWECSAAYGDFHRPWCSSIKVRPVATVLGMTIYIDPSLPENVVQIGNQRFIFEEKK